MWSGPNGFIANKSGRITAIPTSSDGHIHNSTYIYCRKFLHTNCFLYINHHSIDACIAKAYKFCKLLCFSFPLYLYTYS